MIQHRVREHVRRKSPVRSYVRGRGSRVTPFTSEYKGNPHLSLFHRKPLTREELIQKEQKHLYDRFYFSRHFATGINAKNYKYPTLEDFRSKAISNLERKGLIDRPYHYEGTYTNQPNRVYE